MYAYRTRFPQAPGWLLAVLTWVVLGVIALISGPTGPKMLSCLAAGLSIWLFDFCLKAFAPGTRQHSRALYTLIFLMLSPVFIRSGISEDTAMMQLAATAGALLILEKIGRKWHHKPYRAVFWFIAAVLVAVLLVSQNYFADWSGWSPRNWLQNGLMFFYPLVHPGFCLLLGILFFFVKPTDLGGAAQRMLLLGLVAYLLFITGLPGPGLNRLLPAYPALLLLLFPAWDRMVGLGEFHYPKILRRVVVAFVLVQILANLMIL